MTRYFTIDGEFSGLNHIKHCLLTIGMIEVENKDGIFQPNYSRQLYLELKPTKGYSKPSMRLNKLNLKNLKEYGVTEENAVREIEKYLNLKKGDIPVLVAYCGVLDKIFIDQLFMNVKQSRGPFNHEIIEISSLAMGKLNLEWGTSNRKILKALGLEDLPKEEKHNALNDAVLYSKEFCALMNYNGGN